MIFARGGTDTSGPTTPWGTARKNFYGVPGVPTIWIDGVWDQVGGYTNDQQNYNAMLSACQTRWSTPTDVTIDLWGEQIEDETWLFKADIAVEANGDPKTVRVHFVQVLFDYPANTDGRYNNCVMYGMNLGNILAGFILFT